MPQRVLAIVVDYATRDEAQSLTADLSSLPRKGFQLTVAHVDNGNKVKRALTREQSKGKVRLIRSEENLGYAGALNLAVRALKTEGASFDAYWFLNSDLRVEPDCLARLMAHLAAHERAGAVGPVVYTRRKGKKELWGARGVVSPWTGTTAMTGWTEPVALPRWSYIPGCSLLVRASAYDEAGGMPERYRLYYEETELCVRLQKLGWELWVVAGAVAYHDVQSLARGVPARHFAYYFTRNNLYFWKANFGIPWPLQLPRTAYVVAREVLLPLRRARTFRIAVDRLKCVAAGLADAVEFLARPRTRFEKKLFPR